MSSANKIKVTIFGESYTLVTDEPEALVRASAQAVDALMTDMGKRAGSVDARKLAVFAAIQFASKQLALEQKVAATSQDLIQQIDFGLH